VLARESTSTLVGTLKSFGVLAHFLREVCLCASYCFPNGHNRNEQAFVLLVGVLVVAIIIQILRDV
jgi:hypothetical protein